MTCLLCIDCSEVKVYRMSSCFEAEQELAAFLYPPCNIEPSPVLNNLHYFHDLLKIIRIFKFFLLTKE